MAQFAFQRTGDANYPRKMKVLVIGPPKSGKTTFIATAPNVVVADVDAGLMSIAHLNVPYVTVDTLDKLETLLTICRDPKLRKTSAQQMGLPDIETVAIDTLDALQELMKKEILKENRRTQMQQADWGTLKERLQAVLKGFCALPDVNVIFTCHVDITQDENGRQIYAPGLQGGIKNEVAGMVDFSLMSGRRKETSDEGISKITYYLKNEGDEKNPHLGNRSQGRVPEECEPNFQTLHALTFSGINPSVIQEEAEPIVPVVPTVPTVETQTAVKPPEPVAQPVSTTPGVPANADDSDEPISQNGITMLNKEYKAQGLVVPPNLDTWSLGKGRSVAKFFVAWKADNAVGKAEKADLIGFLQAVDAYVAAEEEIKKPVEPAKEQVSTPEPAADTTPTPEPTETTEVTEDQARENVEAIGGTLVGVTINADAKCEVCGETIDDVDIAQLGWNRFHKILDVEHYKAETKK